jgi:hypothetical protein
MKEIGKIQKEVCQRNLFKPPAKMTGKGRYGVTENLGKKSLKPR